MVKIKDEQEEINDLDLLEIARQVKEGYTSGIVGDGRGYRISWSITIEKFKE